MIKKTFRLVLFLVALEAIQSCDHIFLSINGVSKPRIESKESTLSYLSSNSFDLADAVFTAKDSTAIFQIINMIGNIPGVDFFNRKGELVEYSSTGDCPGKADRFAAMLEADSNYRTDSSYHLKDVMDKVEGLYRRENMLNEEADFTILIYWAKYLGKMNKSVMKVMKTIQANKNIRARIYLINMDFQQTWGMKTIPVINLK
jgi:hypothetical protein